MNASPFFQSDLVIVAIGLIATVFFASIVTKSVRTGVVQTYYGNPSRAQRPARFWAAFSVYVFGTLCSLGLITFGVIDILTGFRS